jgi:myo-inositol 2-dehydrogenase/D-chiro-inositol 1-dehydrogenase
MSTKLRVGVVGSGGIADPHVSAWLAMGAQVSVYSPDPNVAQFAARHGLTRVGSLEDLLSGVEVVDVCAPTYAHAEIVASAAAAGRDIVCEKPLALTHTDGAAMIEACGRAGIGLYPCQVVRYFPEYVAAKAAVDAGRIGQPAVLRLSRRGAKPVRPWFSDPVLSGGLVVDQMIHDFDYARWVAGDVHTVYAKVVGHGDGLATGYAILTHETGAITHVRGGWGPPHTVFETSFTLSGSHGQLRHSSSDRRALRWDAPAMDDAGGGLLPEIDETNSPFAAELVEFAAAITTGVQPRVTAEDGLAALDIALAAAASAASGQPVSPKEIAR